MPSGNDLLPHCPYSERDDPKRASLRRIRLLRGDLRPDPRVRLSLERTRAGPGGPRRLHVQAAGMEDEMTASTPLRIAQGTPILNHVEK